MHWFLNLIHIIFSYFGYFAKYIYQFYKDAQIRSKLANIDPKSICHVHHKNEKILCRVVDVYDGDTCTIIYMLNGREYIKTKCRLLGIDTPELSSKNELEKNAAIKCKKYLEKKILNKIVYIEMTKHDKYGGRVLGKIFVNGQDISEKMVSLGLGKPYSGAKKQEWTDEQLLAISSR